MPSAEPVPASAVNLFRLFGIEIKVHYSWLFIFLLIVWSLSAGYLPRAYPGQPPHEYWLAGLVATLLFFASVLGHELCHALVSKNKGIPVHDITLFVFGGVSRLSREAEDPKTEMQIAIVGPAASFVLALVFWALRAALWGPQLTLASSILRYLTSVNIALGVFNLVPGFPLDGGRVLRAALWWKSGSLERATRWASEIGKGVAVLLLVLGGLQVFSGAILAGMWMIFIGVFLKGAAEVEYRQLVLRSALEGVQVRDVMIEDVVTVSPDVRVSELIDHYFLHHGYKGFPVLREGRIVGIVSLKHVRHLSTEERAKTTVDRVMRDLGPDDEVTPDTSLTEALKKMVGSDTGRLVVTDGSRLVGIITKAGLSRFVEMKRLLEG